EVGGVREPRGRGGRLPERAARPFRGGGEGRYRGGGDHAVARRARAKAPAAARTATTPASPATAATAPRTYASTGSASPRWARGRPRKALRARAKGPRRRAPPAAATRKAPAGPPSAKYPRAA